MSKPFSKSLFVFSPFLFSFTIPIIKPNGYCCTRTFRHRSRPVSARTTKVYFLLVEDSKTSNVPPISSVGHFEWCEAYENWRREWNVVFLFYWISIFSWFMCVYDNLRFSSRSVDQLQVIIDPLETERIVESLKMFKLDEVYADIRII